MERRWSRIFGFVWQAWWPLLLYMVVNDLVSLIMPAAGVGWPGGQELAGTMTAALITLGLLAVPYYRFTAATNQGGRIHLKAAVSVIMAGMGACLLFNHLVLLPGITSAAYEQTRTTFYQSARLLQLAGSGIVIPIAEELVFRGFGYSRLRQECSFTMAAIFSSLCFGLFHGNMVQGIYAICLGLLLAWVFEIYQSLWAPVLLHITANLSALLLTWLMPQPFSAVMLFAAGLLLLTGVFKIREDVKT